MFSPDLLHADLLKEEALRIDVLEETEARAQQHGHDVDPKLVDQTGIQKLPGHAYATNHLNCPVPSDGGGLPDR